MKIENMTLLEVRSTLSEKVKAQKSIVAGLKTGDEVRSMTDKERSEVGELETSIGQLEARQKELELQEKIEKRSLTEPKKAGMKKEVSKSRVEEFRSMGGADGALKITVDELRSIAVGADAAASGIATQAVDFIKDYNPENVALKAGVKVYTGLVGDVVIPRFDGTTVKFVTETEAAAESGGFSGMKMTPHRVSGTCTISKKFLAQHPERAAQMIMESFANAVGYVTQHAVFAGTGVGANPTGILGYDTATDGSKDKVNLLSLGLTPTDAAIYKGLVKGKYAAISKAGNQALKFVCAPEAAEVLEASLPNTNSSKFILDNDRIAAIPALCDGSILSEGKLAICGDFSNAGIGIWDELDLIFDPYSKKTTGQVEVTVNAMCDVTINRPELFTIVKWGVA